MEDRTGERRKALGGLVGRGERLIKRCDSWFSSKSLYEGRDKLNIGVEHGFGEGV